MKRAILKLAPGLLVALALLIVLAPTSCGKRTSTADLATPQVSTRGSPAGDTAASGPQSLDEALSELDTLPMPPKRIPKPGWR